ncbi:hypothetical protein D3C86_1030040 [compost metagenome]
MIGFLKKLPLLPSSLGSGNLLWRIAIIALLTSFSVGVTISFLVSSAAISPYEILILCFCFVSLKTTETMIYWPLASFLKMLSRYPNLHSSFVNFLISKVSMFIASQKTKVSLISVPYAPIFCIGVVPTLPGISDMFSNPPKSWPMVHKTNSCQFSPALASTQTASSVCSMIFFPFRSTWIVSASMSWVSSILLPPPRMNFFCVGFSCRTVLSSSTECTETNCFALASMPKVL